MDLVHYTAMHTYSPVRQIIRSRTFGKQSGFPQGCLKRRYCSRQVLDILPSAKVADVPMPRFPPSLAGLRQRFLSAEDDIAMIAVEQLVDGMDLVNAWLERNLSTAPLEIRQLVSRLSLGKKSRIDVFWDNSITCFIATAADANLVRQIPDYE